MTIESHGGNKVAEILSQFSTTHIFTLCGGHISPILTGCNQLGIKVVDVRHEATAVFAADALARMTGRVGVAAVTAGPGLTNTITAIKNAQMAQVPVLIIGGATATVLKNRGSLQDIDHLALVKSITKYSQTIKRVRDLQPILQKAVHRANTGTPGPVFVEIPVDILYPESIVREWYGLKSGSGKMPWWMSTYLNWNVDRIFKSKDKKDQYVTDVKKSKISSLQLTRFKELMQSSEKPILLIGSQTMQGMENEKALVESIRRLNLPTYVSGMARGLLSESSLPIYRHERKSILKEADVVILAGVPNDFRLDYGRHINRKAKLISINLNRTDLYLNRKPIFALQHHPAEFLVKVSNSVQHINRDTWHHHIQERNTKKENTINEQASTNVGKVNPMRFFSLLNGFLNDGDVIVADGGDFVATASYILKPKSMRGWQDPGVFGTLGVGAGFILGAQLSSPDVVVWAIYGDGAFGYSLIEFDSFVRHKIPVIAIIGNNAGWAQIARDQKELLKDAVSTELAPSNYHDAVEALGGKGFIINEESEIEIVLEKAKTAAMKGFAVAVNVMIKDTDFRQGSISM